MWLIYLLLKADSDSVTRLLVAEGDSDWWLGFFLLKADSDSVTRLLVADSDSVTRLLVAEGRFWLVTRLCLTEGRLQLLWLGCVAKGSSNSGDSRVHVAKGMKCVLANWLVSLLFWWSKAKDLLSFADYSRAGMQLSWLSKGSGMVLMQVWFPRVARDFSPTVDSNTDSLTVFVHTPCAIACINICGHVQIPQKNNTLKVNPWWWNVAVQEAGKLKMVTSTVCFLWNGCTAATKRGVQRNEKRLSKGRCRREEGNLTTQPWNVPFLCFDVSPL